MEALRARLGPRTLFLGGVMLAILAALVQPVEDPDFWWHLRTGEWIVAHRNIPTHDLYTFTVSGHVWTDHEYLTEALMWLGYQWTGMAGIAIGFGLLTFVGFCLIWRTADVARRPYLIAGLGLVMGALAGTPIWGPRAQMITFVFSCLELMWLRSYLQGSSRAIIWFPLVMVAWANLHAGWAIGFAFLGVAVVSEATLWLLHRRSANLLRIRTLAIISVLSVAAVALTPHGLSLYRYPIDTLTSPAQQRLIVEWFSPNFHDTQLRAFELMILLLVTVLVLHRPSVYDLLLALLTLALALESVRNIALFVAAATPILIVHGSEIWTGWRGRRDQSRPASPAPAWMAVTTLVLLILIGLGSLVSSTDRVRRQDQLVAQSFPVGATDWLSTHPGVGTRMFNLYQWGGYLIWRLYPDPNRRVYIFGEAALMGDAMLNQYEDVETIRKDWLTVLARRKIDFVVDQRGDALVNALAATGSWRVVYEDKAAVILVRKSARS
ncbi:MAG TPA: hypothetical protein VMU49_10485 [Candidatus Acidoferrales bacterium]|nr:hypothetical protein [Candidatus Acidoferrales bacterium]